MKRLKGWKMCAFLGLAVVLAAAVFMLQVETVTPDGPEACEEPCDDQPAAAVAPRGAMPGPLWEPFNAVGVEPVTGPEGPPMGPVKAQLPAAPVESGAVFGDGALVAPQAMELEPKTTWTSVEIRAAVNDAVAITDKRETAGHAMGGQAVEAPPETAEEAATQPGAGVEAAGRAATVVPEQPETMGTEDEHGGVPVPAPSQLLPARLRVPAPRDGIPVARNGLGYRVPLVVRQRVPAQILGGVYMPEHETYVVLRPGYWELEGVEEEAPAVSEPVQAPEAARGRWLRRLFRKLRGCDGCS